ncbi:MAG: hypothetical protein A2W22_01505 [Candidatus Levybacteria bacterium RBG_16_35_11]|nr:MAG: hypothetical protein A2W22_01505 [Candidatus Levybacteria bacterium RBG_16_35_11]
MTKNEVISKLKVLASQYKNKKYLTLKEIRTVPKLDYYIQFYFRKLGNALQAANLPSSKLAAGMKITNEQLINYLIDLQRKLGRPPKVWDFSDDEGIYKKYSDYKISWSIYKTRFGGLRKAIQLMSGGSIKVPKTNIAADKQDTEFFWERRRFWGEAAELHAMAELLYHGFQAANIPVDEGLDILAVKRNKTYYFQVKHKDLSDSQAIKITKSSFEKTGSGEVYYIFVLLSENSRDFLIIPYHIMNDWIREKIVDDSNDGYLLYIKKKNGAYRLRDKILTNYLNRWEDIK